MAKWNRHRWITWAALLVLLALLLVCEMKKWWFWEAFVLMGLVADAVCIGVKNRCPGCKRMLPLHPPFPEGREYCRHCGSRVE